MCDAKFATKKALELEELIRQEEHCQLVKSEPLPEPALTWGPDMCKIWQPMVLTDQIEPPYAYARCLYCTEKTGKFHCPRCKAVAFCSNDCYEKAISYMSIMDSPNEKFHLSSHNIFCPKLSKHVKDAKDRIGKTASRTFGMKPKDLGSMKEVTRRMIADGRMDIWALDNLMDIENRRDLGSMEEVTKRVIADGRMDVWTLENLMDTEKMIKMLKNYSTCNFDYPNNRVASKLYITNLINWQIVMLSMRVPYTNSQIHDINRLQPTVEMLLRANMFQVAANLLCKLQSKSMENGKSVKGQWRLLSMVEKGQLLKEILTDKCDFEKIMSKLPTTVNIRNEELLQWALIKYRKLQNLFRERCEIESKWKLFSSGIETSSTAYTISLWPILSCIKSNTFKDLNRRISSLAGQIDEILKRLQSQLDANHEGNLADLAKNYGIKNFLDAVKHFMKEGTIVKPGTKDLPKALVGGIETLALDFCTMN